MDSRSLHTPGSRLNPLGAFFAAVPVCFGVFLNCNQKEFTMSKRGMPRNERNLAKRCWVDVFESSYFEGRMRRIFGPVSVKPPARGSLIVGPAAQVQVRGLRSGRPVLIELKPNQIVPDLAGRLRGAAIKSATVIVAPSR
jgi:hypothetical protein